MILTNKTVCITAGNKGLGREIVKLLLNKCSRIIIIDRSEQLLKHDKITYIRIDLSNEKPPIQDVDIFISNLGMSVGPKTVDDMSYEEMCKMIHVNISLQIWFYKNFKYKKFVFINSVLSYVGLEKYSFYAASKAFIRILNHSLIREGKDTLIVYPYKIDTPMFKEVKDIYTLKAEDVAKQVVLGIEKDKREIWIPWFFKIFVLIFRIIPFCVESWILSNVSKFFLRKKEVN